MTSGPSSEENGALPSGSAPDITSLRKDVDSLHQKKESAYQAKQKISQQIREQISTLQAVRKERDVLTASVKDLKVKRDELNTAMKEKRAVLQGILNEKKEAPKGIPVEKIKGQIARMEEQLEIDVMSFEKEKAQNKKIKELKAQLEKTHASAAQGRQLKEARKVFKEARQQAEEAHKALQETAANSQQKHEALLSLSKKIDALREEEKTAQTAFEKEKAAYVAQNTVLKGHEDEQRSTEKQQRKKEEAKAKKVEAQQKKQLEAQAKDVEEKMKKGKKLTTEDLLVFQKD